MTQIAFIGLGNMGNGMCPNLVKAGYRVHAFDINREAVARAEKAGAIACGSVASAVAEVGAVVTMLPHGRHVLDVYFGEGGVAEHAAAGTLFVDCSTIAVEDARKAADLSSAQGFDFIDAPVSGGVAGAEAGTLTFMVGGRSQAFERAGPILSAMGKKAFHAGGSGNGQAAKIANNLLLGISMIATCEAFNLAEKLGLEIQTFFDIASNASGQCWSMTSYCPAPGPVAGAPSNRDYAPGFSVAMMLKDLQLAKEAAASVRASTPLGSQAEAMYADLSSAGFDNLDFSGIMRRIQGKI